MTNHFSKNHVDIVSNYALTNVQPRLISHQFIFLDEQLEHHQIFNCYNDFRKKKDIDI